MNKEKIAQARIVSFLWINAIANLLAQVMNSEVMDLYHQAAHHEFSTGLLPCRAEDQKTNMLSYLMIGAMFFSWCGDIFLMLQAMT
jgi:hypothetical protein